MKFKNKASPQSETRAKRITVILATFLVLGGTILGLSLSSRDAKLTQEVGPSSTDFSSVLGATSSGSGVEITASNIFSTSQDNRLNDGSKKVTLSITLDNTGSDIIEFSPGLNMSVLGDNGVIYIPTMEFSPDTEIKGGPLKPGNALSLDIDFELPDSVTAKKLYYQKDLQSSKTEVIL